MPPPADPTHTVEVTCPGCFHPQRWDANGACPVCHHRATAEGRSGALLPVGTQLKGYVIGEKLGQGGFGITYRGFDLTLKMKVAIKEYYPSEMVGRSTNRKAVVLNGQDHEDLFQYGLKTFLKEAQTIAQLRHPHLVRVLNYFELNETAYLVMDYLEGEDLAKHLKPPQRGQPAIRMPWPRAVKLLLPVLEGLYRVHEAGFMHRDLKPGNLYLTKDDELIILDFGSARQVTSNHTRSLLIFSEGYAPYEQYLQGQLTRQGTWTDVYAITATLYFMLTGCRLSSAMDRKQAQLLQQPDPLKPARHFVPELPAALDAVLMRGLVVEPELRLPTVVDLKQQLERVLVQAEPVAPLELATVPVAPPPKVAPEPPKAEPPKPVPQPAAPRPKVAPAPTAAATSGSRQGVGFLWALPLVALLLAGLGWGSWWFGFRTPVASVAATSPMTTPTPVVVPAPAVESAPLVAAPPPAVAIIPAPDPQATARQNALNMQLSVVKSLLEKRRVPAARRALDEARKWDQQGQIEAFRHQQTLVFQSTAWSFLEQGQKAFAAQALQDLYDWAPQSPEYRALRERLQSALKPRILTTQKDYPTRRYQPHPVPATRVTIQPGTAPSSPKFNETTRPNTPTPSQVDTLKPKLKDRAEEQRKAIEEFNKM